MMHHYQHTQMTIDGPRAATAPGTLRRSERIGVTLLDAVVLVGDVGALLIGVGGLLAAVGILWAAFGPWLFLSGCLAWGVFACARHRSPWPLAGALAAFGWLALTAHVALWLFGVAVWLLGLVP